MCPQYSPPVEDTLCVTFGAKSLNESWCQTQQHGHTNFDRSLSQSHLPETAVALKHQEYRYTFYRVTPNMCIIYRMRNDCLCWLFLVTVDIIREWLATSDWIAFLCGHRTGSLYCTKYCVFTTIRQKTIIWGLFMVSKVNAYSEWIWCTGTLITYHIYLFWHDQVWRHRFRHMGR